MVGLIIVIFVASIISILWVSGIDNHIKYKKEHPNHKDSGWLDWDKKQDQ
jgi:hypothetical protein